MLFMLNTTSISYSCQCSRKFIYSSRNYHMLHKVIFVYFLLKKTRNLCLIIVAINGCEPRFCAFIKICDKKMLLQESNSYLLLQLIIHKF